MTLNSNNNFTIEEYIATPGASGCATFLGSGALSLLSFLLLRIGYGWGRIVANNQTKGEKLASIDLYGPWVMMSFGVVCVGFLIFLLYKYFTKKKQNDSNTSIVKQDDKIEIQPRGITLRKSEIIALRLTECVVSNSSSKMTNRPRLYRLYFELIDGSLIYLAGEINYQQPNSDSLRLTPKIRELIKWMGQLPFRDYKESLPLESSSVLPEINSAQISKLIIHESENHLCLERPRAPFSWLFWTLIPLTTLVFAFAIITINPPLFLKILFCAFFLCIYLLPFTYGYLDFHFEAGNLVVTIRRFLFGYCYRQPSYTIALKEIIGSRITLDDSGMMLILILSANAPSVPLGMQIFEYNQPERCGFFDGNIFVAVSSAYGSLGINELMQVRKKIVSHNH